MKRIVLALMLMFLISSCGDNETNSQQLFRNIYNNTSWADADGVKYTFKTEKNFYVSDKYRCVYYVDGTYNNIEYDNCIYNTVTNTVVSEDNDTFSIRQLTSNGVGTNCPSSNVVITFQVLDKNTIEVKTNYDGSEDSYFLNKIANVSTQDCIDGTSIGYLW